MKVQYQVKTGDFEYIMVEKEVENHNEAIDGFNSLKSAYIATQTSGVGLDSKEWNRTLDGYLTVGEMLGDAYQRMSPEQQKVIQEIKKSMARLNPRETRPPRITNNEI